MLCVALNAFLILFAKQKWAEIYHTTNKQDLRDPSLKIRTLKPVFQTVSSLIWLAFVVLVSNDAFAR